jgi:hypothetical protein
VAQFAYFRLEHKSFNRADWGYGRVAAHARYGANQNKVGHVATVGVPICRTSYDTEREFMKLEKLTTRKNGRTGDTMIVSFPKEVEPEHRVLMMERFLSKVTFDGRTYAQAWEHTDHPDNPHFHAVVVDKDRVTNESVGKFGHSRSWRQKNGLEPNVTEWIRKQWEDTGNELFAELGYNLKFDRRNYLERGAPEPGIHRGHANDDHIVDVTEKVSEPIRTDAPIEPQPITGKPDEAAHEEPMPREDIERPHEADISEAGYRVRQVFRHTQELDYRSEQRSNLKSAYDRMEALAARKDAIYEAKAKQFEEMVRQQGMAMGAKERLSHYQKPNGKFKGISVRLLGVDFTSQKRLQAEQAQREAREREWYAQKARDQQKEYEREIARLTSMMESARKEAEDIQATLYGPTGDELEVERHEKKLRKEIDRLVNGEDTPSRAEVWQAWQSGDVTDDELKAYCRHTGDKVMLMELEYEISRRPEL